jgi:hypothetical protein
MHTDHGLVLRVGHRAEPLPEPIDDWLTGANSVGVTADPTLDLLRWEATLASRVTALVAQAEHAEHAVAAARAGSKNARTERGWHARGRRHAAKAMLNQTISEHTSIVKDLEGARTLVQLLREFVAQLEPVDGPLREAVDGWSRSPALDRLAGVTVFDDEDQFLTADTRRVRETTFGYPALVSDEFGSGWRRDGDDEFAGESPESSGVWTVAYIPRTGEIYASRHGAAQPPCVWLLGSGFADVEQAHALLSDLEPAMRQPNSLILVAERVHATRPLSASGELAFPDYPGENVVPELDADVAERRLAARHVDKSERPSSARDEHGTAGTSVGEVA